MNMNPPEPNPKRKRMDEATSRRLAKLRMAPVDTSELLKAVQAEIPRSNGGPRRLILLDWFSPKRAAAASLLIVGLIVALVITSSSGPVLASAEQLAHIHEEVLVGDGSHSTPVDSINAANIALAAKWPGAPSIPELPKDHVASCCIHMMGRKKVSCVSFETDGVPVTMVVAQSADIKLPASDTLTVSGITYHVQAHGDINMVMTQRGGRWVCLMGKLSVNRLAELASSLRF